MSENTVTHPAPVEGQTQREWLVSLGLAKPSRGRFGKDALAALAQYPDHKWADPKPAAPATSGKATQATVPGNSPAPSAPAAPAETLPQVDPKDVRAWAKSNGHEVAQHGRIHKSVIKAYLAAGGKPVGPRAKSVALPQAPKVRRESTGYSVVNGLLIRQDSCGNATNGVRHSVSRCTCPGGPRAYDFIEREVGQPVYLTLDKPADL